MRYTSGKVARKHAHQLERENQAALAVKEVALDKIYAWRPKVIETLTDIREGRSSRSTGTPLSVSQLDAPRGAWWVLDGHHRAVQLYRGDPAALTGDEPPISEWTMAPPPAPPSRAKHAPP